jgi:hypothetical protein
MGSSELMVSKIAMGTGPGPGTEVGPGTGPGTRYGTLH